jgi:hypothetical protein
MHQCTQTILNGWKKSKDSLDVMDVTVCEAAPVPKYSTLKTYSKAHCSLDFSIR